MAEANQEVHELLSQALPERPAEVQDLLATISYQTATDRPAFQLEGTAFDGVGLVIFTPRTLRQIWLITYMAWQCMHEQAGFVVGFLMQGRPYDLTAPDVGDAGAKAAAQIAALGDALQRIRNAETEQEPWPEGVPIPNPPTRFENVEHQAAFELACFALTFVLLHESYHAQQRLAGVAYGGRAEELAADSFAAHTIVDRANEYAISMRYNEEQQQHVTDKRTIGTFLGLVLMLETTEIGLREPTETHPALIERLRAVVTIVDPLIADPDSDFWVFATSVLLSRLRREALDVGVVPYGSARELFFKCLERYEAA